MRCPPPVIGKQQASGKTQQPCRSAQAKTATNQRPIGNKNQHSQSMLILVPQYGNFAPHFFVPNFALVLGELVPNFLRTHSSPSQISQVPNSPPPPLVSVLDQHVMSQHSIVHCPLNAHCETIFAADSKGMIQVRGGGGGMEGVRGGRSETSPTHPLRAGCFPHQLIPHELIRSSVSGSCASHFSILWIRCIPMNGAVYANDFQHGMVSA